MTPIRLNCPNFSPEELLGLTFLHDTPDGQRVHAQVIQCINDFDLDQQKHIRFLISFGEPSYKEIISYQLSDIVEKQHADEPDPDECLYTFKRIMTFLTLLDGSVFNVSHEDQNYNNK